MIIRRASEYGSDGNKAVPEVAAALNGASVSQVKLDENREIIVVVSVPVQRYRAVWVRSSCPTRAVTSMTCCVPNAQVVILTFGFAALGDTCCCRPCWPVPSPTRSARLSDAAQQVRRGISKRVEIPDFTTRRDEIGASLRLAARHDAALYNRIDAIEAFAADVAHELKNPLTSLAQCC